MSLGIRGIDHPVIAIQGEGPLEHDCGTLHQAPAEGFILSSPEVNIHRC